MSDAPVPPDPSPAEDSTVTPPGPASTRQRIGPYVLLEKRGEGGMGIVYLAEQTEPVRRQVALKIVKHGMDTAQVIARFEAERQALALMDHPAIAKIYDAGTTPQGRPYFAMEFIRGVPITEHCDRGKLTTAERLELFLQACAAVEHAHQKAVIHRDLKPSNVLVTAEDGGARVKIIDFGLAKALTQRLSERTLHTELGMMLGTPEYMSPEQADLTGQDVDTRSDVYSLGVMLYELLVGALPFESAELRQAGIDDLRRRICEQDPLRPSSRLTSLGDRSLESAARRRTDPKSLRRELEGDLDWITMRALEKDRARRYGSPAELAADIRRYLRDEPVTARAPSAAYRMRKFVRRHRLGVAASVLIATGLTAGLIVATMGLVRARRAEAEARREAEAKGQVADFLKDLFRVSNPSEARGNSITARELLDKAAGTLDTKLPDQPATRAELGAIMGEVYSSLGLYEPAESLLAKASEIQKQVLGPEHADTLDTLLNLATTYQRQGRSADARRIYEELIGTQTRILGADAEATLRSLIGLANVCVNEGKYPEAEQLYAHTLEVRKKSFGPEHAHTLNSMLGLGGVYVNEGRFADAEATYSKMLEIERRTLKPDDPALLQPMAGLANIYSTQGKNLDAERIRSELLGIQRRVLGPEHPDTLSTMMSLGSTYSNEDQLDKAEATLSSALGSLTRVSGPEHPITLICAGALAKVYRGQKRFEEAERMHAHVLEVQKRVLGPEHPSTLHSAADLADDLVSLRRFDEAEKLYLTSLEVAKRVRGTEHPSTLVMMHSLADLYEQRDRPADAERLFAEVVEKDTRVLGPDHWNTLSAKSRLVQLYLTEGRLPEAERLASEVLSACERLNGATHASTLTSEVALASVRAKQGRAREALELVKRAVDGGYADAELLATDTDLSTLRGESFDALIRQAKRNAAHAQVASN